MWYWTAQDHLFYDPLCSRLAIGSFMEHSHVWLLVFTNAFNLPFVTDDLSGVQS